MTGSWMENAQGKRVLVGRSQAVRLPFANAGD
jgi:virulence-associated protein VagC